MMEIYPIGSVVMVDIPEGKDIPAGTSSATVLDTDYGGEYLLEVHSLSFGGHHRSGQIHAPYDWVWLRLESGAANQEEARLIEKRRQQMIEHVLQPMVDRLVEQGVLPKGAKATYEVKP